MVPLKIKDKPKYAKNVNGEDLVLSDDGETYVPLPSSRKPAEKEQGFFSSNTNSKQYDENSSEYQQRALTIKDKYRRAALGQKVPALTAEERAQEEYMNDQEARKFSQPKPFDNSKLHEGITVIPNKTSPPAEKPGFFSANTNTPTPPPIQGIPKPTMGKVPIGTPVPQRAEVAPLTPKATDSKTETVQKAEAVQQKTEPPKPVVPTQKEYTTRNVNEDDPKYTNDPNYKNENSKSGWDLNANAPETANQKLLREQKEALSRKSYDAQQERTRLEQEQGERDRQAAREREELQQIEYNRKQLERVSPSPVTEPSRPNVVPQSNVVQQENTATAPVSQSSSNGQSPSNALPGQQKKNSFYNQSNVVTRNPDMVPLKPKQLNGTQEDLSKLSIRDRIKRLQELQLREQEK